MKKEQLSNLFALIFCSIFIISCFSYKNLLEKEKGEINTINNLILDYYHTNLRDIRKYDVFRIVVRESIDSTFLYMNILPQENYYHIGLNDTLGSHPEYFPTNYKVYKNKLFLWNDKDKFLKQDILNIMQNYNVLDSIRLRYQLGIYDNWDLEGKYPERPLFKIDESLQGVNYLFCKNDISIYTKVKSNWHINTKDLPKPDCPNQ